MKDRASQIRDRLKKDGIYKKRSANLKMNASLPILTKISKKFKRKGQQDVGLKVLMSGAFQSGYTNTDIALEIRRYTFRGEYFDETKRSQDKTYQNIMKKVSKYRKEYTQGELDNVLQLEGRAKREAMKSKTIKVGARGRKSVSEQTNLETKLMVWSTFLSMAKEAPPAGSCSPHQQHSMAGYNLKSVLKMKARLS